MKEQTVLHIVPRLPGSQDGVATYAADLARELSGAYGVSNDFTAADNLARLLDFTGSSVLLHYVNYGYQKRGVPFHLPTALQELRNHRLVRIVTIFHELYASGPPWRSAFWLKPFQRRIAQSIARLSDAGVVSSEIALAQLRRLAPEKSIWVQPVPSGFGEPILNRAQVDAKDPHRWIICGGTALVEKSIRSFSRILSRMPVDRAPRELFVIGGTESSAVRGILKNLRGVKWSYQPSIDATVASDVLSLASFGWLDYFHHPAAPVDALFKSTVFAAFCAHGVVPVFPHQMAPLLLDEETFPGLFFVDQARAKLPSESERPEIAWKSYDWYHRRASLKRLANVIGGALGYEKSI